MSKHLHKRPNGFQKQQTMEYYSQAQTTTKDKFPNQQLTRNALPAKQSETSTANSNTKGILRKGAECTPNRTDARGNAIDYGTKRYKVTFKHRAREQVAPEVVTIKKQKVCGCIIF